jgi:transcription termination factor Rho
MTTLSIVQDDYELQAEEARIQLETTHLADLWTLAEEFGIRSFRRMPKEEIVDEIWRERQRASGLLNRDGILDILPDGFGFLRCKGYTPSPGDVYVSQQLVRQYRLRRGDRITGEIREAKTTEKFPALTAIYTVNDTDPQQMMLRPRFENLTPLFPDTRLRMEAPSHEAKLAGMTPRVIDLVAPIGKGQRGLIVSPPKAGKTMVLKAIANSIAENNPECHIICLLVDERPEEVTDMQRTVTSAEVVYSTFDQPSDNHTLITELVLDRCKRLVELGRDVVVLLDSITRLARAYNIAAPASGRILSGGVDAGALYPPKKFFGAARNIEGGGSLTIIGTALVDTGSKMDEVIFEEFKGTGNMELRLDRKLADKRVFPAINVETSGTRREELIMDPPEAVLVWKLRQVLHSLEPHAAIELLLSKLKESRSNEQFLGAIGKSSQQRAAAASGK